MKKLIQLVMLVLTTFAVAQSKVVQSNVVKKEEVKLKSTNKRSVAMLNGYFSPDITKRVLQQITAEQLEDVKVYCNEDAYPDCIKEKLEYNPANPDEDASEATLKSLKLYRIAKFKNIQNGQDFGERSILVATASENKNVGGDCNFDVDFYLIVPSDDIEVIK